jgi:hypothetical protein
LIGKSLLQLAEFHYFTPILLHFIVNVLFKNENL